MAPTTAQMVDTRFCAPQAATFTVSRTPGRWSRRELTVTDDAGGTAVMLAEASRSSSFLSHSLLLLDAASRCPVLTVKRRHQLFATGRRWDALRGHSTSPTDLLFAAVAMPSLFTRGDVHVYLGAGGDPGERRPDFIVVRHGYCGRESAVSHAGGGAAVAKVYRKPGLFNPLKYAVSVNAGVDHAFILALTLILEEIRQEDIRRQH